MKNLRGESVPLSFLVSRIKEDYEDMMSTKDSEWENTDAKWNTRVKKRVKFLI